MDREAASRTSEADGAGDVADLYERYPYPAHGIVSSVVARLARSSVEHLRAARSGKLDALDAGCGTGEQALGLVRAYPDLEVTGVDYSEASLNLARELSRKKSLAATFHRRDLTQPLDGLGPFDLLVCVGTLHHLREPETGLRMLRGVARDGAILLGMVYGTYGKWNLFRARDALELLSGPDASRERKLALLSQSELENNRGLGEYLRVLRSRRRFGPDIDVREALARVLGSRSRTYQADAYTHPCERCYTWAEVAAMLTHAGWRWLGWPRRSGMPDRPSQLFHGEPLRRLEGSDLLRQASIYERLVCPASLYFLATPA
jgi:SAM-dependent methyltransferase